MNKEQLIPLQLTKQAMSVVYATEADVLNMALFGKTTKDWRYENPNKEGNIRDFADVTQLVILITQMQSLVGNASVKKLKDKI